MTNKQRKKQKKPNNDYCRPLLDLIIYQTAINYVGPLGLITFKMCKNHLSDNSSKTGKELVSNGANTNFFLLNGFSLY